MVRSLSLILAGLCLTSLAGAYPAVGDKVTWSGDFRKKDGTSYKIQITKEVISYDKSSKAWKVKIDALLGADKSSDTFETADLYSPEQYKDLMANCATKGGSLEDLKLEIGTYKTCKLSTTTADGTLVEKWWGDMPFGVISKTTRETGNLVSSNPDIKTVLKGL